jgi:hypothetical protein
MSTFTSVILRNKFKKKSRLKDFAVVEKVKVFVTVIDTE